MEEAQTSKCRGWYSFNHKRTKHVESEPWWARGPGKSWQNIWKTAPCLQVMILSTQGSTWSVNSSIFRKERRHTEEGQRSSSQGQWTGPGKLSWTQPIKKPSMGIFQALECNACFVFLGWAAPVWKPGSCPWLLWALALFQPFLPSVMLLWFSFSLSFHRWKLKTVDPFFPMKHFLLFLGAEFAGISSEIL